MIRIKRLVAMAAAVSALMMSVSVSAELAAPVWSATKKGAVEFMREPNVWYRLDLYEVDGEKYPTDTTFTPSETGGLYVDEFIPYHLEDKGDGNYKCRLHIVDENDNILESSPESEVMTYTAPEKVMQPLNKARIVNKKYYFLPTTEAGCGGYHLEFYYGFDKDDLMSFSSTYMLSKYVAKRAKDSEGYIEYDLSSILTRLYPRAQDMIDNIPGYNKDDLLFAVGIRVMSENPFDVRWSDEFFTIIDADDLETVSAPVETVVSNTTVMGVDLSKYGKTAENVIVLGIDKTDASVFGVAQTMDVAPIIADGYTMLPIRFVAEALDAVVGWEDATRSVTVEKDGVKIAIAVGETTALVNNETVALDAPSFIANDRTYLPVRFVSENLGAKVDWDGDTRSVIISK